MNEWGLRGSVLVIHTHTASSLNGRNYTKKQNVNFEIQTQETRKNILFLLTYFQHFNR